MTLAQLEKRLVAIEQEVAQLKAQFAAGPITKPSPNRWWEKIAGTFSSPEAKAAFDEAMRLGRKWRQSENRKSLRRKK